MIDRTLSTYNVKVDFSDVKMIRHAIHAGLLLRCDERISGLPGAAVYRLSATVRHRQTALGMACLQVGHMQLHVDLARLPDRELQGLLVRSAGARIRHDRDELIDRLLMPATWRERRDWMQQLITGRALAVPVQVSPGVEWRPESTRVCGHRGLWFVVLAFKTAAASHSVPGMGPLGSAGVMGVDVGLRPLAVAASARCVIRAREPYWVTRDPAWGRLLATLPADQQQSARRDCGHMLVGAASRALEELTTELTRRASGVVAEALNLGGLDSDFVSQAREYALLDWHHAVLPQRLHAAGIPYRRVEPAYTSLRCSRCGHLGHRRGAVLQCTRCGPHDVHVNAALNLARRGRHRLQRWMER